jgi:hypothetical protein
MLSLLVGAIVYRIVLYQYRLYVASDNEADAVPVQRPPKWQPLRVKRREMSHQRKSGLNQCVNDLPVLSHLERQTPHSVTHLNQPTN